MAFLEALQASPLLLMLSTVLLGLCVGSFLNVVAYRLPMRIDQEFRDACRESYGVPPLEPDEKPWSLLKPGSFCPSCKTPIKLHHNLPVVGWLMLRGRCAACKTPISAQYPIVEAVTGLMSAVCVWYFGYSPQLLPALGMTWALVALTVTDLRTMYLPDDITLPLVWIGLLLSLKGLFVNPQAAIVGAVAGYLMLWTISTVFSLVTKKQGMGNGDFKLMAALGAWLGWQALPQILLLSAMVGSVVGVGLILARRAELGSRIPYGPYIAGAGWIALIWGERINHWYLGVSAP